MLAAGFRSAAVAVRRSGEADLLNLSVCLIVAWVFFDVFSMRFLRF